MARIQTFSLVALVAATLVGCGAQTVSPAVPMMPAVQAQDATWLPTNNRIEIAKNGIRAKLEVNKPTKLVVKLQNLSVRSTDNDHVVTFKAVKYVVDRETRAYYDVEGTYNLFWKTLKVTRDVRTH